MFKKLIASVIILGDLTWKSGFSAFLQKSDSCHTRSAISHSDNGQTQSSSCAPAELTSVHSHPGQLLALMWPCWLQGLWGWTHDINRAHRVSWVKRKLEEIISWTKAIGFVYYTPPASTSKEKAWDSPRLFTKKGQVSVSLHSPFMCSGDGLMLIKLLAWSSSFKQGVMTGLSSPGHHSCQRLMEYLFLLFIF